MASPGPNDHVIGVLALRPKEQTIAAYSPLAAYLEQHIPSHHFHIVAFDREGLRAAVSRKEVDFLIANPDLYVEFELKHGASRIATLIGEEGGRPSKEFAGVIFTRADRHDLQKLADLKGKRIAAVAPQAFGGYLIQGAELLEAGIDPRNDIKVVFLGLPQDNIVAAVKDGRADAGFVRSGVLEQMAAEGRIHLEDFKPLAVKNGHYPHWHSTRTYPEWPFAVMPEVPEALAKKVAIALLSLPANHPAARQARSFGWSIPASYEAVHDVLKKMRAPPYDAPQPFDWREVLRHYEVPIILVLLALIALFGGLSWRNHHLRQALEKDRERLRLAAAVFANAREGMVITDAEGTILEINEAFTEVTGYSPCEVLGNNPRLLKSGRHDAAFYAEMWRQLITAGRWRGEIWNRRKSGEIYPELLSIVAVRDAKGLTTHYIGNFIDITELKAAEEKLRQLAHHDPLTGLPNRALLIDRLQLAIKQADRRHRLLAVCFLDLDGFKEINDTHGHEIGDRLLVEITQRLTSALRAGDTVARLGGDEFVLLLVDLATVEELEQVLARVMAQLSAPIEISGLTIGISASIGVTLYPLDDAGSDGLLRHADHAMYRAKQAGRNRYEIYDPTSTADRDR
ncbi:MAG: diguanylate cyclase [Rhodocyclaceae bacterium]|nr:diguanylate cyclase [Rhodocyclaceae bacterium]